MDLLRTRLLLSSEGQQALANLPAGFEEFTLNQRMSLLRKDWPPELASAVSEQFDLQRRAAIRGWHEPSQWLFTPAGLEMATHPLVAARRARRLASVGLPVADLTCGIGGDLSAVATLGIRAFGLDRDRSHALLASHNVPAANVVQGDAEQHPFLSAKPTVLLDPARREGLQRTFDPTQFSPEWGRCLTIASSAPAAALKTRPGVPSSAIPPGAEVEFVQVDRSLREAAIYLGAASCFNGTRAVHLPSGEEIDSGAPQVHAAPATPGPILFDPESCVTRAGLVRHLAHRLGARMLDPNVGYLTGAFPVATALAAAFEVVDVLPFSVSRLRQYLRKRGYKADEIRRRAFPVEPDELRKLVNPKDGNPVALLCTTIDGDRLVFVARRVAHQEIAQAARQ